MARHVHPRRAPAHFDYDNFREQPILEIWNGEQFRAFRRRLRAQHVFPICAGCCELVKRR